jgi:hypothetical protein
MTGHAMSSPDWIAANARAEEARRAAAIATHHALGLEADDAPPAVVAALLNLARKMSARAKRLRAAARREEDRR